MDVKLQVIKPSIHKIVVTGYHVIAYHAFGTVCYMGGGGISFFRLDYNIP